MSTCGFPGMDVLEFADYDVRNGLHPHPGKVFYTSTHDTTTLVGHCANSLVAPDDDKAAHELGARLVKEALESDARVVMMPLQDVLGLGDEARMNVPGVASGNWSWQACEEDVARAIEPTAALMRETGRFVS